MTTAASEQPAPSEISLGLSSMEVVRTALALIERDLTVLVHEAPGFLIRTIMQPALFSFVFVYVFPRIGQGIGGKSSSEFANILLPGLMASTLMFQGIQAVALPLVQEFSVSREIEDRVMAPAPILVIALAKIISGGIQGMIAAVFVFPVVWAMSDFSASVSLDHPIEVLTLIPLAAFVSSSVGLLLGTIVNPRRIGFLFALLLLPMTLLGCVYYPWSSLEAIRWLQIAVLLNPVVYFSEGLRGALVPTVPHMSLWAVYPLLIGALAVLVVVSSRMFQRRVIT